MEYLLKREECALICQGDLADNFSKVHYNNLPGPLT